MWFARWLEGCMAAHEAWKALVFELLSGIASSFRPPLGRWELCEFGSHRYGCSLPDSDVDFQLKLHDLVPGLAAVDVTVTIGQSIREYAASWPSITGVNDGAIPGKETFEFKLGGKTVDFRSDDHGGVRASGRVTSEWLRAAVSAVDQQVLLGVRIFLAWVKGDSYLVAGRQEGRCGSGSSSVVVLDSSRGGGGSGSSNGVSEDSR